RRRAGGRRTAGRGRRALPRARGSPGQRAPARCRTARRHPLHGRQRDARARRPRRRPRLRSGPPAAGPPRPPLHARARRGLRRPARDPKLARRGYRSPRDRTGERDDVMTPTHVILIDDHTAVRQALRVMLEADPDVAVVGEASDGAEGVRRAAELQPDVTIVDLAMPGTGGLPPIPEMRKAPP